MGKSKMKSFLYVKHFAKKTLCDVYFLFFEDREIEGYRRNHEEKLKELTRIF